MIEVLSPGWVMVKAGCTEGHNITIGYRNKRLSWVQHGPNPECRWQRRDTDEPESPAKPADVHSYDNDLADQVIDWIKRVHKYEKLGAR